MKLTKKQNEMIHAMQNGFDAISDDYSQGVVMGSDSGEQFPISSTVFWNCYQLGLIHQESRYPFDYILSDKGIEIKTNNVDFSKIKGYQRFEKGKMVFETK